MTQIMQGLTFDDVLVAPAHSQVLPSDVDLTSKVSAQLGINVPLLSSAMDTVTEARMAIALAQEGGIGVIHKNLSPAAQAAQVRKVKKYESGVVSDPLTVTPETTVEQLLAITQREHISGMPVVKGDDLIGIVTRRDFRFEENMQRPVAELMTPKER